MLCCRLPPSAEAARGPPDAKRHPIRCRSPPPEGADDRPPRSSVWRRALGGAAGRRVRGKRPVAGRRCAGLDRRKRRLRASLVDLWRALATDRASPVPAADNPGARVPAAFRADAWQRRPDPLAALVWARRRAVGLAALVRGGRAPDAAGDDRVLPGLPALLPALDGPGPGHQDLDPGRRADLPGPAGPGVDPLPLIDRAHVWSATTSGRA